MRIEVNDDAAQLRRRDIPVRCGGEGNDGRHSRTAEPERNDLCSHATGACDDCGHEHIACRCNPGEG